MYGCINTLGENMDRANYATSVMPHLPILVRAASALVGFSDAEDAAQEALLRAWHAWHNLRDITSVRSWLLQIVYNVCLDWQRGHFGTHRRRTSSLSDDSLSLPLLEDDPGSSDHAIALDLHQAIQELDESLRQVILLRFFVGLDATEISTIISIPSGTVRRRIQRAIMQLRTRLEPSHPTLLMNYHLLKEEADV
jgi:RNA polymerase sigma-70 factor (ECF subfamily)